MKKILIFGVLPESLINFRGDLIKFLTQKNFEVVAMSNPTTDDNLYKIEQLGAKFEVCNVSRHGLNIFKEYRSFLNTMLTLKRLRPDYVLAYTVKPIVWTGLSLYFIKNIKFIALIEGLGYSFQLGGFRRRVVKRIVTLLYMLALKKSKTAIFLNQENMDVFLGEDIIKLEKCSIIDGIGVNLNKFKFSPFPNSSKSFNVLMISRFLIEKGVIEYIKAAEIVRLQHSDIVFKLMGYYDDSSDSVPVGIIEAAVDQNLIEIIPPSSDVRPYLNDCHLYVLPSYHEGMPRTIMEAMATGRPVLTTNVPGCRETIQNFENGLLVEKEDFKNLADKILWFKKNTKATYEMGLKSREIAERRFDVDLINKEIFSIISSI